MRSQFTHRQRISCIAAGRLVSSLINGAAHAGRCAQLALQRAVGFSFHGVSVVAGASLINADISAAQGVTR